MPFYSTILELFLLFAVLTGGIKPFVYTFYYLLDVIKIQR